METEGNKSFNNNFYDWATKWCKESKVQDSHKSPDIIDILSIFQILGFSVTHTDAFDSIDMSMLTCGEKGLKLVVSCCHSGLRIITEGINTCSCSEKMINTIKYINENIPKEQKQEVYSNLKFLNIPNEEKLKIISILSNLVDMMHFVSTPDDENKNLFDLKTPRKIQNENDNCFTPNPPVVPEIKVSQPSSVPGKFNSLDSLISKGGITKKLEQDRETKPVISSSSPNLSRPINPPNTSSPLKNMAILKQGYSKLLCVKDLIKDVLEIFDNAQEEVPKFSFNVSTIKDSTESLNMKILGSALNPIPKVIKDTKKNSKLTCRPLIRSASTKSTATKRSMSPLQTNSAPKTTSSTKSQKYAHVKSTIPKASCSKKL